MATTTDTTNIILETEGLTRTFSGFVALGDIDFRLESGTTLGLIGPNGAGKTTFLNLLSGILEPTDGSIYLHGEEISGLSPHERTQRGVSLALQITSVFPTLSVRDNVLGALNANDRLLNPLIRYGKDESRHERALEILEKVGLDHVIEETVENLSHGDQKVLEIALALATDPKLLLLDEPTAGLSASETSRIETLIKDLHGEVTIIIIEHDMEMVMGTVDELVVLHRGEILAEGTPEEIQENERVQEVYLAGY